MATIRSNKPLKYNPIKPNEEGIIELKITNSYELVDSKICIITIQDSVIIDDVSIILTIRQKQFTFDELDYLESVLPTPEGSYMERRIQRFQQGLLYITQNDPHPIYFSESVDWELYN